MVQDRLPGLGEPLFDGLRVDAVRLRVVSDVIDDEVVVFAGHGVHVREFEEFFALVVRQLVVVLEDEPVVVTVGVLLRGQQVAAEVSAIHPEVDELRLKADAHVGGQVLSDLVAHERVVVVVREQRPLFLLHAVDELRLVFCGVGVVIIDREVVGLLRHDPGGTAAAVQFDVLLLVVAHFHLAVARRLVVRVQLHLQSGAFALIEFEEHGVHFGRAFHGAEGQRRRQFSVGHRVRDLLPCFGDGRLAALVRLATLRERDAFDVPGESKRGRVRGTRQVQDPAERLVVDRDLHIAPQPGVFVLVDIDRLREQFFQGDLVCGFLVLCRESGHTQGPGDHGQYQAERQEQFPNLFHSFVLL